jgi:hypothetical protein
MPLLFLFLIIIANASKLITISPAGYKGFYVSGIIAYIKENYDLTDFIFSGSSAGSYNALLMTYKRNPREIIDTLLKTSINHLSLKNVQIKMKEIILAYYTTDDFELNKLNIGVSKLHKIFLKKYIYSNIQTLEQALDLCKSSSHIPYVTGDLLNYCSDEDKLCFDGGFLDNPYVENMTPILHITPSMWKNSKKYKFYDITQYTSLFSKENFIQMYENGYLDTKKNKEKLDKIFHHG